MKPAGWSRIVAVALALWAGVSGGDLPILLPAPGVEYAPPFENGEKLAYEVYWKPAFLLPAFKAGEIQLRLDQSEFAGHPTFRIRAWATSDGALLRVAGIQVKNYFESEIDRRSFRSYRHFQELQEGKRHRKLELLFDYGTRETVIHETDPAQDPPRILRSLKRSGIPAPAVDVLSAFYITRLQAFTVGDTLSFQLNEKGEFQEIKGTVLAKETVRTAIGDFPCLKLSTRGGIFREGGDFRLWFTQDHLRIPTRFEADVKFGKVYGTLIRMETPRLSRGVVRVK